MVTDAPLVGVRVLNFSTLLPGPLATLLLADAGADVIKIERAGAGDEVRSYPPRLGDSSAMHALLNRGKRSYAADLTDKSDRRRVQELIARAHVLLEQFRPEVADRLGIGYDQVAARVKRKPAAHWRATFATQDACATVVGTFAEAAAAGLTDTEVVRRVTGDGFDIATLPSPVASALLDERTTAPSPGLDPLPEDVDQLWTTATAAPLEHVSASWEAP